MSDVFGTTGNGHMMIGNVETTAADAAAIAVEVAAAMAGMPAKEEAAHAFFMEYGAAVLGGHAEVDKPVGGQID